MTRIYIRHAKKEYKNGKGNSILSNGPTHDPNIIYESKTCIKDVTKSLISRYGYPTKIYCSPYQRTIQTANEMIQIIQASEDSTLVDKHVVIVDTNISEYLGNWDNLDPKLALSPQTVQYNVPLHETWNQFNQRIQQHNEKMSIFDDFNTVIWIITHGIVMTTLSKMIILENEKKSEKKNEKEKFKKNVRKIPIIKNLDAILITIKDSSFSLSFIN